MTGRLSGNRLLTAKDATVCSTGTSSMSLAVANKVLHSDQTTDFVFRHVSLSAVNGLAVVNHATIYFCLKPSESHQNSAHFYVPVLSYPDSVVT